MLTIYFAYTRAKEGKLRKTDKVYVLWVGELIMLKLFNMYMNARE